MRFLKLHSYIASRANNHKAKQIRETLNKFKKRVKREAEKTRRSMEEFEELKAAVEAKQNQAKMVKEEHDQAIAEMLVLNAVESTLIEALFGPSSSD